MHLNFELAKISKSDFKVCLLFPKKEVSLPQESLKAASLQGGVLVPRPYWKLVSGRCGCIN